MTVRPCSKGLRAKGSRRICSARAQATEKPAIPMMTENQLTGKFCKREEDGEVAMKVGKSGTFEGDGGVDMVGVSSDGRVGKLHERSSMTMPRLNQWEG